VNDDREWPENKQNQFHVENQTHLSSR
jgi:hypothetical protein